MGSLVNELEGWHALMSLDDLTCTVSDALGRTGALEGRYQSLWPGARLLGPAFTVRTFGGDLSAVWGGIEAAPAGSVLAIDSHGTPNSAFWGERTTRAALTRGLAGAVIDGACRDVNAVRRLGFPVFCTATVPNAGLPGGRGELNVPIALGGQPIWAGDLIVADENGVVVVPKARMTETLERVLALLEAERQLLERGLNVQDLRPTGDS